MSHKLFLFFAGLVFCSLLFVFGCGDSDDPSIVDPAEDCDITITMPVQGMGPWGYAEEITLRWEKSGDADSVRIALKKDNLEVGTIKTATANDGYFKWPSHTFGENTGSDYSISVTALGYDSCSDEQGPLELINTVGCNFSFTGLVADMVDSLYQFDRDDVLDITWDSFNSSGNVKIDLVITSRDIGVLTFNTEDDGHFAWPATTFHNGTFNNGHYVNYMVRITDTQVADCNLESNPFIIHDDSVCTVNITYPQGNSVLTEGDDFEIVFSMENMDGNADLWLYAGWESVGLIATDVDAQTGRYDWTVNDFDYPGTNQNFRIRVISSDDSYCWGENDDFTIVQ